MVNYERNADYEGAKRLMAQFSLCLDVVGTMRDIQTTFLHTPSTSRKASLLEF
jgi:hypothetical protein